ncbi:uncharacterized protein B0I36DRAFT_361947 [Microdochium trichocladiopsis]|uniref:Heme oxygenase-like protein n=1 Tax=Microdochium trichocladiopsis TaxID=1682393 RepID=A0A9P8YBF8_9PEZI|nr:uncharacterized protein B0I36DRAFT_361947 [Microdochium trichocladiopsis]KAH7033254.1 hypothetical protein B0I36DRAFT_361947 [Microdochium trichocladiopsis]
MPSKMDEAAARSLSQSINIATRSVHTKLNKLIIFRLPLALPPQTDDGSNYVSGLLHVAPIYIAFESLWEKIVHSAPSQSPSPEPDTRASGGHVCSTCAVKTAETDAPDLHTLPEVLEASHVPAVSSRIRTILSDLAFPEMRRTGPLQNDLMTLTGWSSCTLAEHLNHAVEAPVLSSFLHHVRHAVETRPHVLLAYGWVLYMALFSGGRFIRAALEAAGPAFWAVPADISPSPLASPNVRPETKERNDVGPLQFFRFNTSDDGEGLKQMFKDRLMELEVLLSDTEREEIVQEAQNIFDFMVKMVMELDDVCGTDQGAGSKLLSLRSRDSVVVEKERRQQKTEQGRSSKSVAASGKSGDGRRGWLRFL